MFVQPLLQPKFCSNVTLQDCPSEICILLPSSRRFNALLSIFTAELHAQKFTTLD